jgi:hypothetical protein
MPRAGLAASSRDRASDRGPLAHRCGTSRNGFLTVGTFVGTLAEFWGILGNVEESIGIFVFFAPGALSDCFRSKCKKLLERVLAGPTRLELATSCVTGRRSNRLNYGPAWR